MKKTVFFLFLCLFASTAWSQELYVNIGPTKSTEAHDHATSWAVSYLQGLGEHAAVGLMYLNEGHIPEHHRDGYTPQFWLRTNFLHRQLLYPRE